MNYFHRILNYLGSSAGSLYRIPEELSVKCTNLLITGIVSPGSPSVSSSTFTVGRVVQSFSVIVIILIMEIALNDVFGIAASLVFCEFSLPLLQMNIEGYCDRASC